MSQAAAVAIPHNPYKAVVESVANISDLVFDFMYGTPERSNLTFMFAIGMGILGSVLNSAQHLNALQACPV